MFKKVTAKKLMLAVAGSALLSSAVYAATFSISGGQGRQESQTGGQTSGTLSFSKSFKITSVGSGTLRLSVMQVLNRKSGGGAEPITQLGVRKNGTKFRFYIVQATGGDSSRDCSSSADVSLNEDITLSVSVVKGGTPTYKIKGISCSKPNPSGDRAGKLVFDNGTVQNNSEYYGKWGAYGTGSNVASATVVMN
jgi:hypothetical protein